MCSVRWTAVFKTGAAACTLTISAVAPTSIVQVQPHGITHVHLDLVADQFLKPSAARLYAIGTGGNARNVVNTGARGNSLPATPVVTFTAVTFAPGITAPELSEIVPRIAPGPIDRRSRLRRAR